jgi:3-dehydroquinate dehydratase/shikimate dehydrogenase
LIDGAAHIPGGLDNPGCVTSVRSREESDTFMICISISQESRRMALADMLNASRQCDLLEVRLDRFGKAPDLGDILSAKPKPVIMSCRRPCDGGAWDGTEDERLAILRQCIISKADYVEIELDVADQIRPFPPAKRVISYTNLSQTPPNLAEIYGEAQTKKPDVIKLTTLARTPEEAWPLVQILAKPAVPTVAVGLGSSGVMLSVLGTKFGAPWTYAALERGMEAHPGQPTVADLVDVYHYHSITRSNRLVGVTGFGERERATAAALNAIFAHFDMPVRCLPLGVGSVRLFRKIVEAVKLAGAVIDPEHRGAILEMATNRSPTAERTNSADLLIHKDNHWHAHDTQIAATVSALEAAVASRSPSDAPLKGRMVLIAGTNATARNLGKELQERGCMLVVASHDRDAALSVAVALGCRYVQFEALYSTNHDILIVCDSEKLPGQDTDVHPGYLKRGMTVLDARGTLEKSHLMREAEQRGCAVVGPGELWLEQVALQARLMTGKEVEKTMLAEAAPWMMDEG